MARRQHLTLTVVLGFVVFLSLTYFFGSSSTNLQRGSYVHGAAPDAKVAPGSIKAGHDKANVEAPRDSKSDSGFSVDFDNLPSLDGDSIAPKLENATLKAELGRATWRFLHTMVSRYPEKPTPDERKTLESFFHLFGRLYPCGDCARHFRGLLKQYPPQTSNRNAAASWLCAMHNKVNVRLEKPQFDCNNLGDFYDCGCGDDKKDGKGGDKAGKDKKAA
ncbi:hypothetical protein VHEMI05904 [[Torrubiella] hemipterigena]|uniref:Sulfhydryl oxidase n=1 Tax=[Torrubiella] hemipterigena TaxID=1531966 RepID=A0A0A1TI50_9HYPO|nr:hypothetical protein VHEMI05904 [[Torrubiella] hemipterigena]